MSNPVSVLKPWSNPTDPITCTPKSLPVDLKVAAAETAVRINPTNRPRVERVIRLLEKYLGLRAAEIVLPPEHLALITQKYWGTAGVHLTVQFLDTPYNGDVASRILQYMNEWTKWCNAKFSAVNSGGQVRIARNEQAYYSYLGTDILHIPPSQHTMMLGGITMQTSDAECMRVIPHETGHTMGFPHEHMRAEIVSRIDPQKAISYFGQTQGWSPSEVQQQVLTPLDKSSIRATPTADDVSVMCYQLPSSIMKDGQPVVGGSGIDSTDAGFAQSVYPSSLGPTTPPVVQPPVTPPMPPIVNPTMGPSLQQVIGVIDGVFAGFYHQLNPMLASWLMPSLRRLNQAIDANVTRLWPSQALHTPLSATAGTNWQPILVRILDGAIRGLEDSLDPTTKAFIELLRPMILAEIDKLLGAAV